MKYESQLDRATKKAKALTAVLTEIDRLETLAVIRFRDLLGGQLDLPAYLLKVEAEAIANALRATEGRLCKAARLLGISRQALAHIIDTRHHALSGLRSAKVPRGKKVRKV